MHFYRGEVTMPVDVKAVCNRRMVRFSNLQEMVADVERLCAGDVRMLGNKTFEQILRHLTLVINRSIDGSSAPIVLPWYLRLVARPLRGRFLAKGLKPGFRLPSREDAKVWPCDGNVAEALDELRLSVERFGKETKRGTHPAFGKLTGEEWTQFHLRHSELHLSFATPA
jgi:hypothetical protein